MKGQKCTQPKCHIARTNGTNEQGCSVIVAPRPPCQHSARVHREDQAGRDAPRGDAFGSHLEWVHAARTIPRCPLRTPVSLADVDDSEWVPAARCGKLQQW